MWLERFVIIVTSLHRDFLPSSWGMYAGTRFDWAAFVGTLGLFVTLLFLFVRFLPAISIFEMRTILPEAESKEEQRVKAATRHLYGLHGRVPLARTRWWRRRKRVHEAGYTKVDAYSPYPIEELSEALELHKSPLPKIVLAGASSGCLAGWGLEYWAAVIEYPMNIGGRPVLLLARLHRPRLRDHDPLRGGDGGLRHARPERPAPALPPGLQRAELRPRLAATASSSASSRATRSSTGEDDQKFLRRVSGAMRR